MGCISVTQVCFPMSQPQGLASRSGVQWLLRTEGLGPRASCRAWCSLCGTQLSQGGRSLGKEAEAWREKTSPNCDPGAGMAVFGPFTPSPQPLCHCSVTFCCSWLDQSQHQQQGWQGTQTCHLTLGAHGSVTHEVETMRAPTRAPVHVPVWLFAATIM